MKTWVGNLTIFGIGIILVVLIFGIGWLANDINRGIKNERVLDGLNIRNANFTTMKEITKNGDENGDWICINIKGMEYERAVEVCNHEAGHEIFAEYCEKNISKCIEVTK